MTDTLCGLCAEIPYEITVWTGELKGAGTDANVFIQMYGENGKSEEYPLRNRTDNFEQGQMDKFKVQIKMMELELNVKLELDNFSNGRNCRYFSSI